MYRKWATLYFLYRGDDTGDDQSACKGPRVVNVLVKMNRARMQEASRCLVRGEDGHRGYGFFGSVRKACICKVFSTRMASTRLCVRRQISSKSKEKEETESIDELLHCLRLKNE